MEEINGDKLRGHLEAMVLATLEQGEAMVWRSCIRLEEAGCGLLRLKEGSSTLPCIASNRPAKSRPCGSRSHMAGSARRRIYRLTPKARKLQAGRVEWQQFVRILGGILGAPA